MSQHSPKYHLRARDLLKYLTPKRLETKWRKKTRYDLKRHVFPDPVEFLDIHANIDQFIKIIRSSLRDGTFDVGAPRRYHSEKTLGLCRLMVQISPDAALLLQCLSDKLYSEVKKQSPSKNAFFEPQDHSFKKIEDQEYGTFKSWKQFQNEILKFSKENKFIVVTDISNYYDFIDLSQLRNVITSFVKVEESLFDFYLFIVSSLSWRPDFMPVRQIGLPQIDLDAPRLLAHCYLFELDRFMEQRSQKNYARFMDDIDAGVDTIEAAKLLLRDTDLVLQSRSLRLNAGKTRILTAKDAFRHFRVRENSFLDKLEKVLETLKSSGKDLAPRFAKLSAVITRRYERQFFVYGNGEKILKRVIGIYNSYMFRIPDNLFYSFIHLHPNLRDSALRNASICGFRKIDFSVICNAFDQGLICDDNFRLTLSKRIVEGKLIYDGTEVNSIKEIIARYPTNDPHSIYAAVWILSRYANPATLFSFLASTSKIWGANEALSRLVAGMWPRLRSDPKNAHKYYRFLSNKLSPSGIALLDFHQELVDTASKFGRIRGILLAQNDSLPLKCSHEKALVLQTALVSSAVSAVDKAKLAKSHAAILAEQSYANHGLF